MQVFDVTFSKPYHDWLNKWSLIWYEPIRIHVRRLVVLKIIYFCEVMSQESIFSSIQSIFNGFSIYQSFNWSVSIWMNQLCIQSIDRSINQSINQSFNQSINQSIHQSIHSIHPSIPSIHPSINQSTNWINQSINSSINQSGQIKKKINRYKWMRTK